MSDFYIQVEPFLNMDFVSSIGGSFAYSENGICFAYRFSSDCFDNSGTDNIVQDGYLVSNYSDRTPIKYKIVKQFDSYHDMLDELNRHLLIEELVG